MGTKQFTYRGEEQTFVRFSMKPDGTYYGVNQLPKDLVSGTMPLIDRPTIIPSPSGGF